MHEVELIISNFSDGHYEGDAEILTHNDSLYKKEEEDDAI